MFNIVSMEDSNESRILPHDQYRYTSVQKLHNRSQSFMNLTILFINQISPYTCIGLCDGALSSMLKALYIKEDVGMFLPLSLSLDDLFMLLSIDSNPDLDSVMFVNSIHFLASFKDTSIFHNMKITHLMKLLKKVDELLYRLSPRVTNYPSEFYQSIFQTNSL